MFSIFAHSTGCPKIDGPLVRLDYSPRPTAKLMESYRDPTPGHLRSSVGQVTLPGDLTPAAAGRQRSVPERYPGRTDQVSNMVKEHSLSTRYRAVGMVNGGMTQGQVAEELGVGVRTIKRWMARDRQEEALENRKGRGRETSISRVAKIVLAKSALKRHQSTRKLARKLTGKHHPVSKSTVQRYLKQCLHLKPLKPHRQPKLTAAQKRRRLEFARTHANWSIQEWRWVLFTDESPFQLCHPPNRQNDRIWAHNSSEVPVTETVKHPLKVMVWGDDEIPRPVRPAYNPPGPDGYCGLLRREGAEGVRDVGDAAAEGERGANEDRTSA